MSGKTSKPLAKSLAKSLTNSLTIGQLAGEAEVGIDTIRFYERRGLLPKPARTPSGYRLFRSDTVTRLQFIRRAKALGFSLDEIKALLRLQDQGGSKAEVKKLTDRKLDQIETKISDLSKMQDVLKKLASECSGAGDIDGCPIIEALTFEDD
jgi:Hg(II)-responsive transcriptional regulator